MLWLYYQYSGTLPDRYREWVLHDGTCRTWLLRVFLRSMIMVAPIAAALFTAFLVLGDSWTAAVGAILLGLLVTLRYSLGYSEESVDSRLIRHGYPPGHGIAVRRAAHEATHAAETARYNARYRQPPLP